jgi:hypothetical protein
MVIDRFFRSSVKQTRALQECNSLRDSRRAWLQTMSRGTGPAGPLHPFIGGECLMPQKLPQVAEGRRPGATEDGGAFTCD